MLHLFGLSSSLVRAASQRRRGPVQSRTGVSDKSGLRRGQRVHFAALANSFLSVGCRTALWALSAWGRVVRALGRGPSRAVVLRHALVGKSLRDLQAALFESQTPPWTRVL